MEILNPVTEDYHIHSSTWSDGLNSVDEIVRFAGEIDLKKIAITDHSQAAIDVYGWYTAWRSFTRRRWKNVFNDVEVIFGVEGDLLNEQGDICDHIQGKASDFLILSAHDKVYSGNPTKITEAYLNAIKKHAEKIKFLGHLDIKYFDQYLDLEQVVEAANSYNIPLEVNCANLVNEKTNLDNLRKMLSIADRGYINSDAHTLGELRDARKEGFKYLKDNGFLKFWSDEK